MCAVLLADDVGTVYSKLKKVTCPPNTPRCDFVACSWRTTNSYLSYVLTSSGSAVLQSSLNGTRINPEVTGPRQVNYLY